MLILAVLRYHDERHRNSFMRSVEAKAETPKDRLLVIFDILGKGLTVKNFQDAFLSGQWASTPKKVRPYGVFVRNQKF